MKCTVKNSDLASLITQATNVSRGISPIKIIAQIPGEDPDDIAGAEGVPRGGEIRIISFSETIVSELSRPAQITQPGTVCINPKGLDQLLKVSVKSDALLTLETLKTDNEDALRLSTSRSSHEFPQVNGDVFDTITPGSAEGDLSDLTRLGEAIVVAKIAVAPKGDITGSYATLVGVHLHPRGDLVDIVGIDGHRLAMTRLRQSEIRALDLSDAPDGITIRPEAFGLLGAMLSSGAARLSVIGNTLVAQGRDGTLSIRLIGEPYPDYTRMLDQEHKHKITLDAQSFEMAIQRSSAAIIREKNAGGVKLSREDDGIYLSSVVAGQSSSEWLSDAGGDPISIGFDPRYMISALSAYGSGDVDISFTDVNTPIEITQKARPHIRLIVMPCAVI